MKVYIRSIEENEELRYSEQSVCCILSNRAYCCQARLGFKCAAGIAPLA